MSFERAGLCAMANASLLRMPDFSTKSAPWAQVLGASIHWIPKEDPVNSYVRFSMKPCTGPPPKNPSMLIPREETLDEKEMKRHVLLGLGTIGSV